MTMIRLRIILGFIAGGIFAASSAAHSLLGWPQLNAALTKAQAPASLITTLAIGWHFAGVAMLTFGCIVFSLFLHLHQRRPVSLRPALIIGLAYVVYGAWAYVASGLNPFFFIFITPGLMLLVAVWPPTEGSTDSAPGRA